MLYSLPSERVTRSMLESEYQRTGLPIYEVTYAQYLKKYQKFCAQVYDTSKDFCGLYFSDKIAEDYKMPKTFILLNKNLPNYDKLMVLWHEVGHHSCVKANCLCAKWGFQFRKTELHAELACIFIAHKRGKTSMVLELVKEAVMDLMNSCERSSDYIRNAYMMVKHPDFIAAVDSIKPELNKWLNQHRTIKERYEVALADTSSRMCRWKPTRFLQRFAQPSN